MFHVAGHGRHDRTFRAPSEPGGLMCARDEDEAQATSPGPPGIGPLSAPKMTQTVFLHTKRIYRRWNNRGNLFPAKFPLQKIHFPLQSQIVRRARGATLRLIRSISG